MERCSKFAGILFKTGRVIVMVNNVLSSLRRKRLRTDIRRQQHQGFVLVFFCYAVRRSSCRDRDIRCAVLCAYGNVCGGAFN